MIFRVREEWLLRVELSFANETGLFMVCARFNSLRDWCDISPIQGQKGLKNWHLAFSYNHIYMIQSRNAEIYKTWLPHSQDIRPIQFFLALV